MALGFAPSLRRAHPEDEWSGVGAMTIMSAAFIVQLESVMLDLTMIHFDVERGLSHSAKGVSFHA
jgi:hypothetical protein